VRVAILQAVVPGQHLPSDAITEWLGKRHEIIDPDSGDLPDVYLNRYPSWLDDAAALYQLSARLESNRVPGLNSLRATCLSANKHLSHLWLLPRGIQQPDWMILQPGSKTVFGELWSGETIAKPLTGGMGQGLQVASSLEEAESLVSQRGFSIPSSPLGAQGYILQPYIPSRAVWRLVVSRRQGLISAYKKTGEEKVLSVSSGAVREYQDPPEEMIRMAAEVISVLGLEIAGLDFLETDRGAIFLESNANFGFDTSDQVILRAIEQDCLTLQAA
jgi:glutathione synthase/RimK-type ligase-like ATP-grasp enzyme